MTGPPDARGQAASESRTWPRDRSLLDGENGFDHKQTPRRTQAEIVAFGEGAAPLLRVRKAPARPLYLSPRIAMPRRESYPGSVRLEAAVETTVRHRLSAGWRVDQALDERGPRPAWPQYIFFGPRGEVCFLGLGEFLSLSQRQYVDASRNLGISIESCATLAGAMRTLRRWGCITPYAFNVRQHLLPSASYDRRRRRLQIGLATALAKATR